MEDVTETLETRLGEAEASLKRGDFDSAGRQAGSILEDYPESVRALYLLAVCLRYAGDHTGALAALEKIHALAPDHARAKQELGHVHRALDNRPAAIDGYRLAVGLNPALTASWKALLELIDDDPQYEDLRRHAREQLDYLAELPPELLAVKSRLHEGKLYQAERICRAFLQSNPHHKHGMHLLALLGMELNVYDDAEFLLESCLVMYPDFRHARLDYIQVLQRRQKFAKALEEAEKLKAEQPENFGYRNALANAHMAIGNYDEALSHYGDLLADTPDAAPIHLARGHALKTLGRREEAEQAYHDAYRSRPNFGDAYWSLANLKTYRFGDDELDAMQRHEASPETGPYDRYHLCFALGKAFEDRQDYDNAFFWYDKGNRLKLTELNYDADAIEAEMQTQQEVCGPELFAGGTPTGSDAGDPIFIVGLPRAGSTLLEQILAAHSQVDGTFELPNILAMAFRLNGRRHVDQPQRYPGILHELDEGKLRELGDKYIEDTRIYRKGAPFFTDKMPNNFRHIGLIHKILPNAKIIDARRHPMACCFSGFKQLFAEGQEFTYSLENVGRYYRNYVDLMDYWDSVLPGRILRVEHEELVHDFENQVRRLLDFCGLSFEENCLRFHESARSVRTASSEQVRQPISEKGLDQWRHFSAHLDPLRKALGPVLERYPE